MTNKEMQQTLLDKMDLVAQCITNTSTYRDDAITSNTLEKLALAYQHLREEDK